MMIFLYICYMWGANLMKTIVKECILNFVVYIFPLLFIISGFNQPILLFVGLFISSIISLLMSVVYVAYFITHRQQIILVYRKLLLGINFLIFLICIFYFIRK